MRKVFRNHAEVCHAWASREFPQGSAGNISFVGDVIMSYHWWDMAQFYVTKSGKKYLFIRDHNYSNSTSKHMSHLRRAVPPGWKIMYVHGADTGMYSYGRSGGTLLDHEANIRHFVNSMIDDHAEFAKAKLPRVYIQRIEKTYETLKEYCRVFKRKVPPNAKNYLLEWDDVKYYVERKEKEQEEKDRLKEQRRIEREKKLRKENRGLYEEWLTAEEMWMNGAAVRTSFSIPGYGYLSFSQTRMRIKDNEVETSMGAYVPVREAKVLWERIKAGKDVKGWKIGYYTVIAMNGELKIGCHVIKREEIDRFIEKYKW